MDMNSQVYELSAFSVAVLFFFVLWVVFVSIKVIKFVVYSVKDMFSGGNLDDAKIKPSDEAHHVPSQGSGDKSPSSIGSAKIKNSQAVDKVSDSNNDIKIGSNLKSD